MNGGELIARVLYRHGARYLFTLCGGHISPILVAAKQLGVRVVDVRDEASAVFAADAVARLSGTPGVAAVTAGPGLTNTLTAVKNAQLAQSPVLVLGGATGTILKGRGSLQDIDQMALMQPHVKWARAVTRVRDLVPAVERALFLAQDGVPGPVFVECPVDLLYDEASIRRQYLLMGAGKEPRGLAGRAASWYLNRYVDRLFRGVKAPEGQPAPGVERSAPSRAALRKTARLLAKSQRPMLLVGSQAMAPATRATELAAAVDQLGLPTYLSGMARGLLGKGHPRQFRHARGKALREADLVLLAGVPCDFRLGYGRQIRRPTRLVAANLSEEELVKNCRPHVAAHCGAGLFLECLAQRTSWSPGNEEWLSCLADREAKREGEIGAFAGQSTEYVNPLALLKKVEELLDPDSVLVADGGDFVGTASYIVSPRAPLRWLDPGVFGTLGVGGGFAIGTKLMHEASEVWILYGDGSAAYSLAEFDTFVRHNLPVIALVGNDASWAQIAREQVELLGDDVGTVLYPTDYHEVAEGYGGVGFLLDRPEDIEDVLIAAKREAAAGRPVLINARIGATDFRKGSISM